MKTRITINAEHRKCLLDASDYHCYYCSRGEGVRVSKPGDWSQQVPLGPHLEQQSQTAGGEGGAQWGSVTQLAACLPVLRCVGPIREESSFLSLQNTMHPPLCSSLCPPGPVSRTAAVSGADGLGACERTTCSHCPPPFPPSPTPPAPASDCSRIKPRFSLCSGVGGTLREARFLTTCPALTATVAAS